MKRTKEPAKNFNNITARLREYFESDPNTIFALIFGSAASGRLRDKSDLDIAVYFKNPPEGMKLLHLVSRLSDLAGMEVDITLLNNASAFLRHQVMKHRSHLIIKDEELYRHFREKTISDYDEYKYVSGMNRYD